MTTADNRIEEHTKSMFRHEELHEEWIGSCARYLASIFGESLRGKTIIDYACGRGNWSLAFLRAGAGKVIAIDASPTSAIRLKDYCHNRDIRNLEVLVGNIVEDDLPAQGDFVWLYGILPHIEEPSTFLNRIKMLAVNKNSQIYVYQFNAKSLREFTVQTCRNFIVYGSESEFRKDSFLYVRAARMRARDDLTAPRVNFSTATEIQNLLRGCGIYIKRRDDDFQHFLRGKTTEDFYPHQFLCTLSASDDVQIREPKVPYAREVEILHEIASEVFFTVPLTPIEKRNIAIGLFNTHFAFLKEGVYAHESLIEIFLFLMYVLRQSNVTSSGLAHSVAPYYALFRAALAGEGRSCKLRLIPDEARADLLTAHLLNNNIRI